jgi:hypothetical protein
MKHNVGSSVARFLSLATLILAPACASMRPPAQNNGPTLSTEGVQLAVLKQSCTQTQEPNQPDNDLEMRFMSRGSLQCSRELQLDAGTGICLGGKAVKVKPVTFVPSTPAGSSTTGAAAEAPGRVACDS